MADPSEERELTFKLEMPIDFDEDTFRARVNDAVYPIAREFGGRCTGWSMNHGVLSRAAHYAAIAREVLGR